MEYYRSIRQIDFYGSGVAAVNRAVKSGGEERIFIRLQDTARERESGGGGHGLNGSWDRVTSYVALASAPWIPERRERRRVSTLHEDGILIGRIFYIFLPPPCFFLPLYFG